MKKLHLLVLKAYIGPFVMTFFIVMFILLMQFVWVYVDDFMGKGLPYLVIAELLLYASANLVPMALPLAVLLSSIMTFGNLAEQYELVGMKSAGLGLIKIMQPLIIFIVCLAGGAFYFTNNISPEANLRFRSLLWDVTEAKPALELKEGVFYSELDGYSIRVMDKDEDSRGLRDVLIYDHTDEQAGNKTVIRAREGVMEKTPDGRYLVLHLKNGYSYEESWNRIDLNRETFPHIKNSFDEDILRLDLSGFGMERSDEDLWKNHMKMLSMGQLSETIDSLSALNESASSNYDSYFQRIIPLPQTDTSPKEDKITASVDSPLAPVAQSALFDTLQINQKLRVLNSAVNMARNAKNYANRRAFEGKNRDLYLAKHYIEWHRKLILSFAVIVLFFIGAPLGAIIKKGGMGIPVLISVVLFLVFHVLSISGEKMAATGVLPVIQGMWLSTAVLFPLSLWLTYKATRDAALFDGDTYRKLGERLAGLFQKKEVLS